MLILVPLAALLCLRLSDWQFHRLDQRKAANSLQVHNESTKAENVSTLLHPGQTDLAELQYRPVTATGTFDDSGERLVRRKILNTKTGYYVATPLKLSDGRWVMVNRGWIETPDNPRTNPVPPAPPSGTVTVTGRLQPSIPSDPDPADMPAGQTQTLDVTKLGALVGAQSAMLPMYIDLESSTPAQGAGLTPIPLPEIDEGPHLSYALQWIAFAIMFVIGLTILVRRELKDRRLDDELDRQEAEQADLRQETTDPQTLVR